jgi:hypothetical protein
LAGKCEHQRRIIFSNPIITSFYCDDADRCTPLFSPTLNSPTAIGQLDSLTFSLGASAGEGCMVVGTGPNVGYAQPSCDGFSPPTSISVSIEIDGSGNLTETPVPAALPLLAASLGALGLLGWRKVSVAFQGSRWEGVFASCRASQSAARLM